MAQSVLVLRDRQRRLSGYPLPAAAKVLAEPETAVIRAAKGSARFPLAGSGPGCREPSRRRGVSALRASIPDAGHPSRSKPDTTEHTRSCSKLTKIMGGHEFGPSSASEPALRRFPIKTKPYGRPLKKWPVLTGSRRLRAVGRRDERLRNHDQPAPSHAVLPRGRPTSPQCVQPFALAQNPPVRAECGSTTWEHRLTEQPANALFLL